MTQNDSRPHIVLDIETTGFYYAGGDEIIELAAERVVNRVVVDRFHAFIRPSIAVPPAATAVHGLTDTFLAEHGSDAASVFQDFAKFVEQGILVGHNIRNFDFPFLEHHFSRHGLVMEALDLVDTLELARRQLRLLNYKLGTVATHFGIDNRGAHRADRDVEITREVFLRLTA
ncbi:MAG: 3'-5' exonuclease [Patescibacteria group bacterium]|jgi:DNA polymerase-3 subunit epsilon